MEMKKFFIIVILVMLGLVVCLPGYAQDTDIEFNKLFQQKYDAWVMARDTWIKANGQYSYLGGAKDEQENLIKLGSKAIPYFVALFEQQLENRTWDNRLQADMEGLVCLLSQKTFPVAEFPEVFRNRRAAQQLYVDWWKTGRLQTPVKFAVLFEQWDSQARAGNPKEADKTVARIKTMGVEIMPMVMKKIENGDERLVPWVKLIMRTRVPWKTADLPTVLEWWEKNKESLTFPPVVEPKSSETSSAFERDEAVLAGFDLVPTLDTRSVINDPHFSALKHANTPTAETCEQSRYRGDVSLEVGELLKHLKKALNPEFLPADKDIVRIIPCVNLWEDGTDYLVLSYEPKPGIKIYIQDGRNINMIVTPSLTCSLDSVKPHVVDLASDIFDLSEVDEPMRVSPLVGMRPKNIGNSRFGNLNYAFSQITHTIDWFSNIGWWSDGHSVLFSWAKVDFAKMMTMSKATQPIKPRVFKSRATVLAKPQ